MARSHQVRCFWDFTNTSGQLGDSLEMRPRERERERERERPGVTKTVGNSLSSGGGAARGRRSRLRPQRRPRRSSNGRRFFSSFLSRKRAELRAHPKNEGTRQAASFSVLRVALDVVALGDRSEGATLEPPFDEGSVRREMALDATRHAEEARAFYLYAKGWWKEYSERDAAFCDRAVKLFARDEAGEVRCVCSFLTPLRGERVRPDPRPRVIASPRGGGGGENSRSDRARRLAKHPVFSLSLS